MLDVTESYLALRREAAAFEYHRDCLVVKGADAASFLQGQLSADVAALADGGSTWSLLLQPQGKVSAWLRVTKVGPDEVVLDVDGGSGPAVQARLERFKLRVDATIEPLDWRCVGVRGPRAQDPELLATLEAAGAAHAVPVDWRGLPGVDLLGPAVELPDLPVAHILAVHNVRVEQGWPAMGHELDDTVIPAEVGRWFIDASVSFTKGCYTGQELVARIDSRGGNTPRHLRGIVLGSNVLPPPGATVVVGGEDRGRITSVGESLDLRAPVALAYVHRSVELGGDGTASSVDALLRWDGGEAPGRVVELPFALP